MEWIQNKLKKVLNFNKEKKQFRKIKKKQGDTKETEQEKQQFLNYYE